MCSRACLGTICMLSHLLSHGFPSKISPSSALSVVSAMSSCLARGCTEQHPPALMVRKKSWGMGSQPCWWPHFSARRSDTACKVLRNLFGKKSVIQMLAAVTFVGEMGLSGRGQFRSGRIPIGVWQGHFKTSKALSPVLGLVALHPSQMDFGLAEGQRQYCRQGKGCRLFWRGFCHPDWPIFRQEGSQSCTAPPLT